MNIFQIWDNQTNNKKIAQDSAYIELNNLYLSIESGDIKMKAGTLNTLWHLVSIAYPTKGLNPTSFVYMMQNEIVNHWHSEIEKLPNFNNC